MQLGTRWSVGEDAPDSLPESVRRGVERVEAELEADGVEASSWRWTLTWLERRATAELDDGTIVREQPDGSASIIPPSED